MKKKIQLGYLVSHPIQYQAPLLRELAQCPDIDLKVYFCSDSSVTGYVDKGFQYRVKWDIPLLEGYPFEFLPCVGKSEIQSTFRPFNYGLRKRLKKDKIDVLWLHGYVRPFFIYAIIVAKLLGIKVLVRAESMGYSENKSLLKPILKPLFYRCLNKIVDGFLSIGTLNKNFFLKHGIPRKKIYWTPYSVDNQFFQKKVQEALVEKDALRKQLGLEPNRFIILYASKFMRRKCADDLIRAYLKIAKAFPENQQPYLLLIGEGNSRPELEKLAKQAAFNTIYFLGFVNQSLLPAYYNLCDVFVLPSERENWGLIVNEVMNAGKPIVVSDQVGCAPDLIHLDENGRIFRTRDIDDLSKSLRSIMQMSLEEREMMGQNSLRIIRQWGIGETATGIIDATLAVMENRPAAPLKLLIVNTHPVDYHVEIYRKLNKCQDIDSTVCFLWNPYVDYRPAKRWPMRYSKTLLEGYRSFFIKNWVPKWMAGPFHFLGIFNPGIFRAIKNGKYDAILLFGYNYVTSWLVAIAAKIFGVKIIFKGEVDLLESRGLIKRTAKYCYVNIFYRFVDSFTYSYRKNAEYHLCYHANPEKMIFMPCAVDNHKLRNKHKNFSITDVRHKLGLHEEKIILFVGRLVNKKRPGILLEAFSKLIRQYNINNIRLVYIGDGDLLDSLSARARQLEVDTRVDFPGFLSHEETYAYYKISHVLVLPSSLDPSPKVVNEAMNFFLPIVVSDHVGTANDLIIDGKNGYIFPLDDELALTKILVKLLSNDDLYMNLSNSAFETVSEWSYDIGVTNLIHNLLRKPNCEQNV